MEHLAQFGSDVASTDDDHRLGSRFEGEEAIAGDSEVRSRDLRLGRPDRSSSGGESDVGSFDGVRLSVGLSERVGRSELNESGREELAVRLDPVYSLSSEVGLDDSVLTSDLRFEARVSARFRLVWEGEKRIERTSLSLNLLI